MNPSVDPCPDQLRLIETGDMPRVETAILRDRLARDPEQRPSLADVNAYKHRLHALRCENVSLRLLVHNLETQLNQMRATRGWKLLEKIRWWRQTTLGWIQRKAEPRPYQ
jgi:hypothetical protein